jgi:ubiquinone/menaquinone biosynthesis C-methylase UbiE
MDGWQLEADSAQAYERYLVPALMTRWADVLLDQAAPREGERVLDVGCGTGIVARRAAARVGATGSVTGLDLNPGMLAVAQHAASEAHLPIEWRAGNAAALPFPDAAFDVVASHQMLQFVPDPRGALTEMRRVLAPAGRAAVGVCRPLEHNSAYRAMADALERHAGPEAGAMMRSPFPPWTTGDWRALLESAGWHDVHVRIDVTGVRYPSVREFLRREAACSPLAGPIGALGAEAREALVRELEATLRGHVDDDGVLLPIEMHVGVGR